MKTNRSLALGILFGACCGAVLVVEMIFGFPQKGWNSETVSSIYYLIFGTFACLHPTAVSIVLGALVGALLCGLARGRNAAQKMAFGLALAFLAGVAVGDVQTLRGARVLLQDNEAAWRNIASKDAASAVRLGLGALESGDTNRIERFRAYGFAVISNYIRQADQLSTGTYSGIITAGQFTNDPVYTKARDFLAQHPPRPEEREHARTVSPGKEIADP